MATANIEFEEHSDEYEADNILGAIIRQFAEDYKFNYERVKL